MVFASLTIPTRKSMESFVLSSVWRNVPVTLNPNVQTLAKRTRTCVEYGSCSRSPSTESAVPTSVLWSVAVLLYRNVLLFLLLTRACRTSATTTLNTIPSMERDVLFHVMSSADVLHYPNVPRSTLKHATPSIVTSLSTV